MLWKTKIFYLHYNRNTYSSLYCLIYATKKRFPKTTNSHVSETILSLHQDGIKSRSLVCSCPVQSRSNRMPQVFDSSRLGSHCIANRSLAIQHLTDLVNVSVSITSCSRLAAIDMLLLVFCIYFCLLILYCCCCMSFCNVSFFFLS